MNLRKKCEFILTTSRHPAALGFTESIYNWVLKGYRLTDRQLISLENFYKDAQRDFEIVSTNGKAGWPDTF